MPLPKMNLFNSTINKLWNSQYADDVGVALIHLGAAGWVLSALAQIVMIAKNKDIDKKEKKFLIPQEIADGVINVGLYYTICQVIKNIADFSAENIHYMTKRTDEVIQLMNPDNRSASEFIKGFGSSFRALGLSKIKKQRQNLSSFFDGAINYLNGKNIPENFKPKADFLRAFGNLANGKNLEQQIEYLESAQRNFKAFKNGVGVIAAVGASILACNLITPVARNITANYYQKKLLKRNGNIKAPAAKTQIPVMNYYPIQKTNTFNAFKI